MGRSQEGARSHRRVTRQGRQDRSHTTPVPVSTGGRLQRQRQHRRRGELHLQSAIGDKRMLKTYQAIAAGLLLMASAAAAQDAKAVIDTASKAMGADIPKTVEFSVTGFDFVLGQASLPDAPAPCCGRGRRERIRGVGEASNPSEAINLRIKPSLSMPILRGFSSWTSG